MKRSLCLSKDFKPLQICVYNNNNSGTHSCINLNIKTKNPILGTINILQQKEVHGINEKIFNISSVICKQKYKKE